MDRLSPVPAAVVPAVAGRNFLGFFTYKSLPTVVAGVDSVSENAEKRLFSTRLAGVSAADGRIFGSSRFGW